MTTRDDAGMTGYDDNTARVVLKMQRLGGRQVLLAADVSDLPEMGEDDVALRIGREFIKGARRFVRDIQAMENVHVLSDPPPEFEVAVHFSAEGLDLTDLPPEVVREAKMVSGLPKGDHHLVMDVRLNRPERVDLSPNER